MQQFNRKPLRKDWAKAFLAIMFILQISTAIGFAQQLSPGDREEQNRRIRQEALDKEARRAKKDVFLQKQMTSEEELSLPEEEISFVIDHIRLNGDDTLQFRGLQTYLAQYERQKIGIEGINLILKRANNWLIDRGFITTRLVTGEQDLSSGTLTLLLIPGKIEAIRFAESAARANWRTAFPVGSGDVLNLRSLEQGLEQLKRIASREVDMYILPGSKPGLSEVVITTKQGKRVSLMTAVDDSGSKATGKLQLSGVLMIDNLFNANDIFRINFNQDGESEGGLLGSKGQGFYYSIPDGNWTYSLSKNKYDYHQTIAAASNDLVFSGTSDDFKFNIEKLLHRDQSSKMHLDLGLTLKKSRSYVNDTEITVQRRKTSVFTIGLSQRKYIGQAMLDVRLSHKQGVPWFNAQVDPAAEISSLPTLRYSLWNLDATYLRPVNFGKVKAQYRLSFSGQFTNDKLYAADCISLGNRYTVRGFDGEETLLGERGLYLQNEWSIPLGTSQHQVFLGLDYGLVGGASVSSDQSKDLFGSTLGFRGPIGKNAQYEVFVGWALHKPDTLQTAKQTYGFQVVSQI